MQPWPCRLPRRFWHLLHRQSPSQYRTRALIQPRTIPTATQSLQRVHQRSISTTRSLLVSRGVIRTSSWGFRLHILRKRSSPFSLSSISVLTPARFRIGERRLRQPQAPPPYSGLHYVQQFGRSCPQQRFSLPRAVQKELEIAKAMNKVLGQLYQNLVPDDEDCKAYATSPGRVELRQSPRSNHKYCETFRCHVSIQAPRRRCKYRRTCPFPRHSSGIDFSGYLVAASKLVDPPCMFPSHVVDNIVQKPNPQIRWCCRGL